MSAHDGIPKPMSVLALIALGVCLLSGCYSEFDRRAAEKAQDSVAIVETPDGWGSAVAFKVRGSDRTFFLTAKHVVENKGDLKIRVESHIRGFKSGHFEVPAQTVFISPGCDAAILTIPPVNWKFRGAKIERFLPRVGTEVYAVGNMHGANFDNTVSQGIVAQLGVRPQDVPNFPWSLVDQTTAINLPGSSGGPVFDRATGRLLGIQVGNMQSAVFLYLPSRVLLAKSHAEGWGWLFGDAPVPSEKQLQEFMAKVPKEAPTVIPIVTLSRPSTFTLIPNEPEPRKYKGLDPELKKGHR